MKPLKHDFKRWKIDDAKARSVAVSVLSESKGLLKDATRLRNSALAKFNKNPDDWRLRRDYAKSAAALITAQEAVYFETYAKNMKEWICE
jgi:hypothetical protein